MALDNVLEVVSKTELQKLIDNHSTELCDRCNKQTLDIIVKSAKEIHLGGKLLQVKYGNNIYTIMSSRLESFVAEIVIDVTELEFSSDEYIPVVRH